MAELSIYPYVKFPSLERAEWGLVLTEGPPAGKWLDWQKVGDDRFTDPIAPLIEFDDAQKALSRRRRGLLEETPYVEIRDEDRYLELLAASMREAIDPIHTWPADVLGRVRAKSLWDGPGVYDARDLARSHPSVEEYEREDMAEWARRLLDDMFTAEGWKRDLGKLVFRNR